jgi:hypothetical protein
MVQQHGSSKYSNDNCRCDECRSAWAQYIRDRKLKRKRWVATNGLPESVSHGESAYANWGCRCSACRAAWNEACKRRWAIRSA